MSYFEPNKKFNRLMTYYNWQKKDWPKFSFSLREARPAIVRLAEKTGSMTGVVSALPTELQLDALVNLMVAEALKSSAIEGEYLKRQDVMSSIRNNLGVNKVSEKVKDKSAQGMGELMVDARKHYNLPLTEAMLLHWHSLLFKGDSSLTPGKWRTHNEPMQVVSGAMGKQKVHFEAPPSSRVNEEMRQFVIWFNSTAPGQENALEFGVVRAALAHLYFESIHPFEDGNGRIGRVIAEKALSQGLGRPVLLSLSRTIEANKSEYYEALSAAQKSLSVTQWINYFVNTTLQAQNEAIEQVQFTLKKARFFDRFKEQLSDRHTKVLKRMFDEGPQGFQGGMNAGKYGSLTKTSKATATRDLQYLLQIQALLPYGEGGGRSTRYQLNLDLPETPLIIF